MNALCLITLRPNDIWCNFLNSFNNYKVFVFVDDNSFNLVDLQNKYKNICFLQVYDDKCKVTGYIDTSFTLKKLITGWDKALYYFGVEDTIYDFIWYIEDDVFFCNENTIMNIDKKYTNDDLISNEYFTNIDGNKNSWHWKHIKIQYEPPYYNGMMCAVRISCKMMKCINDYASNNKTLFFLEALFPTIAIKNNLIYNNPSNFKNIYYRHNFNSLNKKNIDENELYHPLKDVNIHLSLR